MKTWTGAAGAALLMFVTSGCDGGGEAMAPSSLEVHALSGGSCAEGQAVDPLQDLQEVEATIQRLPEEGGEYEVLARTSRSVGGGGFTLGDVPETLGRGHELFLFGEGLEANWYAADTDVQVVRNQDNPVDLLLTRFGGFSCVPSPSVPNVVFPAAVDLGDGRILITGGFTEFRTDDGPHLGAPSPQAWIFDSRTGEVDDVPDMPEGRAAHAMAFLPAAGDVEQDRVLVVGGMNRLGVDQGASFPFVFDAEDARNDLLLYHVDDREFVPVEDEQMDLKRAFPRLHTMADGTVVITGGGAWPLPTEGYDQVEVFDPRRQNPQDTYLVPLTFGFTSFWPRTGHSLDFVRENDEGQTQLLVWGGVPEATAGDAVAELMTQSSEQINGTGKNGGFEEVTIVSAEGIPRTFFHEMTPLGDQRFLLTGGSRASCSGAGGNLSCSLGSPAPDEAWLIELSFAGGGPVANLSKVPGLDTGRVFHSAHLSDPNGVAVVGGWSGTQAIQNNKIRHFDVSDRSWTSPGDAEGGSAFVGRGGHFGLTLRSRSALLIGGADNLTNLGDTDSFVEVYTPSNITIP